MNRQQQNGTITTKYLKQNGYHQSASSSATQQWDSIIPVPKLSFTQAACVVFAFAILCFANSYNGDFVDLLLQCTDIFNSYVILTFNIFSYLNVSTVSGLYDL
jgi:hypothetical protein